MREDFKKFRAETPDNGKILILEAVLPENDQPHFGKIMDMEMLVSPGGIERTAKEFEQLLNDAELKLNRIITTESMISIVEAVKL